MNRRLCGLLLIVTSLVATDIDLDHLGLIRRDGDFVVIHTALPGGFTTSDPQDISIPPGRIICTEADGVTSLWIETHGFSSSLPLPSMLRFRIRASQQDVRLALNGRPLPPPPRPRDLTVQPYEHPLIATAKTLATSTSPNAILAFVDGDGTALNGGGRARLLERAGDLLMTTNPLAAAPCYQRAIDLVSGIADQNPTVASRWIASLGRKRTEALNQVPTEAPDPPRPGKQPEPASDGASFGFGR